MTLFENLSDLSLIEIFSYLSCFDVVYSFNNLNRRLTGLIIERGFYRHVNLSFARYNQFKSILSVFDLNQIESLIIDCYASALQLKSWPYLPNLRKLRVNGAREWIDAFIFAQQHQHTLTHLTVQSNRYYCTSGTTIQDGCYPSWNLYEFIDNTLNNLSVLQTLDFGTENTTRLHNWSVRTIQTHLTYLRITVLRPVILFNLMKTQPLAHTLQQLHITMSDIPYSSFPKFADVDVWPQMELLHSFTFIKSFKWYFNKEWLFVDKLTSSDVMPMLRRMKFCIVIDINDLDQMYYSSLFTDYRHIDVHYAFMINNNREHIQLIDYIRCNSRPHHRQIASATFSCDCWSNNPWYERSDEDYGKLRQLRQHLFYSLPWSFNEFVELCVPNQCVNDLEVFPSFSISNNRSSHLVKLHMLDNVPEFVTFLPHTICANQIVELHLFRCNRQISTNLPSLSRLILIDSLDSLNNYIQLTNLKAIQITLHYRHLHLGHENWTVLRTLSTLTRLTSLRILLYDMRIPTDNTSCQIIAETALIVSDFSFCFRRSSDIGTYDINISFMKHSLFIKQLQKSILALSSSRQLYIVCDQYTAGINIWL